MLEFLKDNYFIPLYGITLAIGLVRYKRYYDSVLKYLPILIAYTLLTEILGILIRDYESFQIIYLEKYDYANYFIYNIYDVVFFLYFYFVFWKIIQEEKYRSIIKYGAIIYIVATLINPFFQNVLIFPQIYASSIGSIVLIISILLYHLKKRREKQKKNRLLIWISIGLLVFNIFFPLIMLAGRFDYDLYKKLNFQQLHYFLIVAMYTCFIIGFLKMGIMKPVEEEK